jgi:hypothetical protein
MAKIKTATYLLLSAPPSSTIVPYDLFDAAIAKLRAALAGQLSVHSGYAGENVSLPYAELYQDAGPRQPISLQDFVEAATLHVNVYTKARSPQTADALVAALSKQPLVFSKGLLVVLRCTGEWFDKSTDPGPGGSTVYQEVRTFEATFSGQY